MRQLFWILRHPIHATRWYAEALGLKLASARGAKIDWHYD